MNLKDLEFDLPKEFIAQEPVSPRDNCKLMVLNKKDKSINHDKFFNLKDYLKPGDVLVFNDSKVLPARLIGHREKTETKPALPREILLLKQLSDLEWDAIIGGKSLVGDKIILKANLIATVMGRDGDICTVKFNMSGPEFFNAINKAGVIPTPPYIKQMVGDGEEYQTVYAKHLGSAAVPTAGLHFTQRLLDELKQEGIQQEFITLHVGLGTFQPIKVDVVEDHPIHSEYYSVEEDVYKRLKQAKQEGRRIIAVGTTSVRVLETIFSPVEAHCNAPLRGQTNIFIYPGYKFQAIDALITNFHTPHSSLLALVYALASQDFIQESYKQAILNNYRFFSFGDAMLIE